MTEKRIDTLVDDIYELVEKGVDHIDEESLIHLGESIAKSVHDALVRGPREGTLRMSNIGTPCNRKLWYEVNGYPKEELRAPARIKFLFGHILEDLVLFLAEQAGHKVEGRQTELEIEGIKGHRDAIIDGTTADVKSASTYSFKKFKEHGLSGDDPFGYLDQIESYRHCGESDPLVTDKDRSAFVVIDKTLGNICLDFHEKSSFPIEKKYQYKKEVVSRDEPPARHYDLIPEGKAGNLKLGIACSYCDFKRECYPGLRTFAYSRGPVHLAVVKKEPDVQEITLEDIQDSGD